MTARAGRHSAAQDDDAPAEGGKHLRRVGTAAAPVGGGRNGLRRVGHGTTAAALAGGGRNGLRRVGHGTTAAALAGRKVGTA